MKAFTRISLSPAFELYIAHEWIPRMTRKRIRQGLYFRVAWDERSFSHESKAKWQGAFCQEDKQT